MGSVRVFVKPNRTEPKNFLSEPNRTEPNLKNVEPNRTEPKKFPSKPNRTEPKKIPKILCNEDVSEVLKLMVFFISWFFIQKLCIR